jgi:hypothetical protein
MLCRRKNKNIDLSSGAFRSCGGSVCGGWRFFYSDCDPRDATCVGRTGAWLPVASVCSLDLYGPIKEPPAYVPPEASSSSSSSDVATYLMTEGSDFITTEGSERIVAQSDLPVGALSESPSSSEASGADSEPKKKSLWDRLLGSFLSMRNRA